MGNKNHDNNTSNVSANNKIMMQVAKEGAAKTFGATVAASIIFGIGALILSGGNPEAAWEGFKKGFGFVESA